MDKTQKTLVIGASTKTERYSNMAVNSLREKGYETIALGLRGGKIADVEITTEQIAYDDIDTVTVYVGADRLGPSEDYIISLKPKRVIFNPGAENPPFAVRLKEAGIEVVQACTLVMLSTDQY